MEKENDNIQYSFRLNLNNPTHMLIHRTLENLDPELYKSKSNFIFDALEKYIKGITPEVLIGERECQDYVTREELEELKESITQEAVKEVLKNMFSMFAAVFTDGKFEKNTDD